MSLYESQLKKSGKMLEYFEEFELVGTEAWKARKGKKIVKVQPISTMDVVDRHEMLAYAGIPVPKVDGVTTVDGQMFKVTEWAKGKTFRELITEKTIRPEHYERLGWFLAKTNSLEVGDHKIGFVNYLPKNLFLYENGEVGVIDLCKLITTPFPENAIVRYILTEDLVDDKGFTFELRSAFLDGYRKFRELGLAATNRRQAGLLWGKEGVLLDVGRYNERPGYVKTKAGPVVLDLKSGDCRVAFMEAMAGANYVYSTDIHHVKLGPQEILKTSDFGKLLAYMHGFDGRDLHYKYCELNSDWFIQHLRDTPRKWTKVIWGDIEKAITPERYGRLKELLGGS